MSRTVILSPHHDDVALFTAFNAIRYRAHIIVVLKSVKQERDGITDKTRRLEELEAAAALDCTVEFWDYPDTNPDWQTISRDIAAVEADQFFIPAYEGTKANEQHNRINTIAAEVVNYQIDMTEYLTYTTEGKSTWGHRVEFEPAWVPMKLRALACHVSQASLPSCMEHFLRDQHEYVA